MRLILVLLLLFVSVPSRAETADVFSLLISGQDGQRMKGASQLSKMSYDELKDFDLVKTECGKL